MSGRELAISVVEPSQAGEARRETLRLADELGWNATEQGRAGVVVTELATNLVRHAHRGQMLVRPIHHAERSGLEILSVDEGPGIGDVGRVLADGYSTRGGAGTGLGAVRRMSDRFAIHSVAETGTVIRAELWPGDGEPGRELEGFELGVVSLPHPAERIAGDGWCAVTVRGGLAVLVCDGLGHGPDAAAAAGLARDVFAQRANDAPGEIIRDLHAALAPTRGAAAAVGRIDVDHRRVRWAAVGNISGAISGRDGIRSLATFDGTLGHHARKIQELAYPWPEGGLLIVHTDGVGTRWNLDRYPGLTSREPALIAATIVRDARRRRDDATVLVLRETRV